MFKEPHNAIYLFNVIQFLPFSDQTYAGYTDPCFLFVLPEDFPAYPPEAVEVRNTFIHVASPTAEDADRPVLSCPASKIGWIEDLLEDQKNRPPTPPAPPTHPPPVLKQKDPPQL